MRGPAESPVGAAIDSNSRSCSGSWLPQNVVARYDYKPVILRVYIYLALALLPELVLTLAAVVLLLVVAWRHQTSADLRVAAWVAWWGLVAAAVFWYATIAIFAVIWFAIYVTK